ncbi:MAG: hypothetical protein WDZ45_07160 [Flavobacteriaceae bacterium]
MRQSIKNQLKKIAIVFTLLLSYGLTTSCSSDDDNGNSSGGELYFKASFGNINFEVDNTNKEQLDGFVETISTPNFTYYGSQIVAQTIITSGGDTRTFLIYVYDDEPIGTQTYSGYQEFHNGGLFYGVQLIYFDQVEQAVYSTNLDDPQSSVTITTINNSVIKGTFSGTLLSPISGEEMVITNGEFQVERTGSN